jgi:23S rRNA (cytosine1962-C5)-methyltransferase
MRRLRLARDVAGRLRAGHPWVYREALAPADLGGLRSGAVVEVQDPGGRFVARGVYDAASPIAVRAYTLEEGEAVDEALIAARLRTARLARRGAFDPAETTAYRLCNGEGDRLPGIVVDVYAHVAVLRFDGEGAQVWRDAVREALRELPEVRILYERTPEGPSGVLVSTPGEPAIGEVEIREHGVRLLVDVVHGQKTGFFLDQRDNRLLIKRYARGLRVWNGFCYTGGFSVQAALGGAERVVSVDRAAPALAVARRNFLCNGLDPAAHDFVCADALQQLRQGQAMGQRYGLVIADPPSFAPSERALGRALPAYRDLFAQAMAVVEPGGLLAAGSCSSHVNLEMFLAVLGEAAVQARRPLRILEVRGQPPDHPTLPAFPEGRYLKFVLARLD